MEVASIDHDLGIDFNDLLSSIHQVPVPGLEPGPDQTHAKNLTVSGADQSFNQILSDFDGIFGGQIGASIGDPSFYDKNPSPSLGIFIDHILFTLHLFRGCTTGGPGGPAPIFWKKGE